MKKHIAILFLLTALASCHKREYPASSVLNNEQEIFFDGTIDGQPIAMKIGNDGYYCYSDYTHTSDSVYIFEGELRKFGCGNCANALKINLGDYMQRRPGSAVVADSVFATGKKFFMTGVTKPVTARLDPVSGKSIVAVKWKTDKGFESSDNNPLLEFGVAGAHSVSLTVRTSGGCENTVISKVFAGGSSGILACSISSQTLSSNGGNFTATIVGGKAPFTYQWMLSDGFKATQNNISHNFLYAGSYPVRLIVTDAEGNQCESSMLFVAGNDKSSCSLSFGFSGFTQRNALLNAVRVQWRDQDNVLYSSDNVTQDANSYFEVTGTKPFDANENGQNGRLLTLRMNLLLSSGDKKIKLATENTQIVFAYK